MKPTVQQYKCRNIIAPAAVVVLNVSKNLYCLYILGSSFQHTIVADPDIRLLKNLTHERDKWQCSILLQHWNRGPQRSLYAARLYTPRVDNCQLVTLSIEVTSYLGLFFANH